MGPKSIAPASAGTYHLRRRKLCRRAAFPPAHPWHTAFLATTAPFVDSWAPSDMAKQRPEGCNKACRTGKFGRQAAWLYWHALLDERYKNVACMYSSMHIVRLLARVHTCWHAACRQRRRCTRPTVSRPRAPTRPRQSSSRSHRWCMRCRRGCPVPTACSPASGPPRAPPGPPPLRISLPRQGAPQPLPFPPPLQGTICCYRLIRIGHSAAASCLDEFSINRGQIGNVPRRSRWQCKQQMILI